MTDAALDALATALIPRLNRLAALEATIARPPCSTPRCSIPAVLEATIRTEANLKPHEVRWCERHAPSHKGHLIVTLENIHKEAQK